MAIKESYNIAMKIANIAELKNRLSEYLSLVENGEEIEIRKRNVPIARVVPLRRRSAPGALGAGKGTVRIRGRLTGPLIPGHVWEEARRRQ
jgi:prevent-host-death family protein